MKIRFSKPSTKFINASDKPTKTRIKKSVDGLPEIPPKEDIKVLQRYHPSIYRLRAGKYRIVYEIISLDDSSLFISVI